MTSKASQIQYHEQGITRKPSSSITSSARRPKLPRQDLEPYITSNAPRATHHEHRRRAWMTSTVLHSAAQTQHQFSITRTATMQAIAHSTSKSALPAPQHQQDSQSFRTQHFHAAGPSPAQEIVDENNMKYPHLPRNNEPRRQTIIKS